MDDPWDLYDQAAGVMTDVWDFACPYIEDAVAFGEDFFTDTDEEA